MKFEKTLICVSFIFTILLSNNIAALSRAWTISDTEIPYLVMVKGNTERSFIVSNPVFCDQAPAACRFFISHAQAHIQLNHLILPPYAYAPGLENVADCFAAKTAAAEDVKAAFLLLQQPEEAAKYSIPGDLKVRTENIKKCAIQAKNWIK